MKLIQGLKHSKMYLRLNVKGVTICSFTLFSGWSAKGRSIIYGKSPTSKVYNWDRNITLKFVRTNLMSTWNYCKNRVMNRKNEMPHSITRYKSIMEWKVILTIIKSAKSSKMRTAKQHRAHKTNARLACGSTGFNNAFKQLL